MSGETGDLPPVRIPENKITTLNFERIKLVPGSFTQPFLDRYPLLADVPEVVPIIHVANAGQPEAVIASAGYSGRHTDEFLRDHGTRLVENMNDTIITMEWPKTSDVVDLRWRSMADYLQKNHSIGIKLFGTSFGGRESLVALKKFKQLEGLGFNVPIEAVVVVVAPTSKETVQSREIMGTKGWLMLQAAKMESGNLKMRHITSTLFPSLRADAVRIRELVQSEPFVPGDFQQDQVIHYFGTDPEGILDPLVNQPKAIAELREAGATVVEHWYKPDPAFAHKPAPEEMDRVVEDAISIFKQADRVD